MLLRFGLDQMPSADLRGLTRLYAAWCAHVPFDNTRKLIALQRGDDEPLPGMDPSDFLDTWLTHGAGGTCWPSCNALFAVLMACGFDAQRVTASMMDMDQPNHGTIIVRIDGHDYLADSSMLVNRPIALIPDQTVIDADPLRPVEYETIDGEIRLWFEFLTRSGDASLPCRVRTRDVSESVFCEAYEASRAFSPFNQQLIATRNRADRIETLQGRSQFTRHADGTREHRDHDGDTLREALVEVIGLSSSFVETWADSGALTASLESSHPQGDPPPMGVPPSRRPGHGV